MKILFSSISIKDKPTGIFNRAFVLAKEMVEKGHTVTLLTMDKRFIFPFRVEHREGVKIVSFPNIWGKKIGKFGYSILGILGRFTYMIFNDYDVVHSDMHRPISSVPCLLYRFFRKTIYISDWQDFFGRGGIYDTKAKIWQFTVGPFDNWLEHYCIKKADGVVPLSELLKNKALVLGKREDQILKVWGGSDVSKIYYFESPLKNRRKFNLSKDAFIVLFAAMHENDYLKHNNFFLAIKEMRNEGINIMLVRTGKYFDQDFRFKNDIGSEIIDAGYINYAEYGDFLSCANCFILLQEPTNNVIAKWPNVIGDYLAAGRPILANVVGELKFLYEKNNASLVPLSLDWSVNEYAQFLKSFLVKEGDFNLYSGIREFALKEFSWRDRASDLLNFYLFLKHT